MEFFAVIKKHEGIDGAYVEIPFDVQQVFSAKRVKVNAEFDKEQYQGSIVTMNGCALIGLTKEIRSKIGKKPGDTVWVKLEKDENEREIILPEDFAGELEADAEAKAYYYSLSYTNKKSFAAWIESAKKRDTREARIVKAVMMLRNKQKRN